MTFLIAGRRSWERLGRQDFRKVIFKAIFNSFKKVTVSSGPSIFRDVRGKIIHRQNIFLYDAHGLVGGFFGFVDHELELVDGIRDFRLG